MSKHVLKIIPEYFDLVAQGLKDFEIRKDDRDYQVGDTVLLSVFIPTPKGSLFTGDVLGRRIKYIFRDEDGRYGLQPGYCILGLEKGGTWDELPEVVHG